MTTSDRSFAWTSSSSSPSSSSESVRCAMFASCSARSRASSAAFDRSRKTSEWRGGVERRQLELKGVDGGY
eukprot:31215-Pelagococcus_subviridis.AAC.12